MPEESFLSRSRTPLSERFEKAAFTAPIAPVEGLAGPRFGHGFLPLVLHTVHGDKAKLRNHCASGNTISLALRAPDHSAASTDCLPTLPIHTGVTLVHEPRHSAPPPVTPFDIDERVGQ